VCKSTRKAIFGDFAVQVGILHVESDIFIVVRPVKDASVGVVPYNLVSYRL
jgi:hypothetical protein